MRVSKINASKNMAMRIAYMFSHPNNWPAEVDGCKLWSRFALCLVPWLMASIVVWVIMGVIGSLSMLVLHALFYVVFGRKLIYDANADMGPFFWASGREVLSRLLFFCYESKEVEHLAFIEKITDGNRSPLALVVCVIGLALLAIIAKLFFWDLVPFVCGWLFDAAYEGATVAYETVSWWGVWTASAIAIILAWPILRRAGASAWQNFSSSENGKLAISLYKDWKEKNCTIYKVS